MLTGLPATSPVFEQPMRLIFTVVVALLLLRIVLDGPTWLGWMKARPLVVIGLISYSLYLWHVIIFWADPFPARPILNLLLSVMVAIASYHLIEQPFRRRREARLVAEPQVTG